MTEEQIYLARAIFDSDLYGAEMDAVVEEVAARYQAELAHYPETKWFHRATKYWARLAWLTRADREQEREAE